MKKYFKLFFISALIFITFTTSASASIFIKETDDGIRYSVTEDNFVVIEGYNVTSLSLKIPAEIDGHAVKEIKSLALYGNQYINSLEIAEGVEIIGDGAFSYFKNLISVKLPSTVKSVPDSAFKGCSSLTTLTLAEGIERIENGAFEDCKILGNVKIPKTVTYIGNGSFYGCEKLIFNCGSNEYAKAYAAENFISTSYFSGLSAVVIWTIAITAIGAVVLFVILPKIRNKKLK